MRVSNDLYNSKHNRLNHNVNNINISAPVSRTITSGKIMQTPLSTLQAYNISFGGTKKKNDKIFSLNEDTNELVFRPISCPLGTANIEIYDKKGKAVPSTVKKDSHGFRIEIPALDREKNKLKNIEIGSISYYSAHNQELLREQKNQTISTNALKQHSRNNSISVNGKPYSENFAVISEGTVEGKLVTMSADEMFKYGSNPKDTEPIVARIKTSKDFATIVDDVHNNDKPIPKNVKGVIGSSAVYGKDEFDLSIFSHAAARIRGRKAVACMPKKAFDRLNQEIPDNNYVKMSTSPTNLEIDKIDALSPVVIKPVNVPKNGNADRVMLPTDKDFTQENVGLKAYNLGKLKKISKKGGFEVPEFIAIPSGVLAKIPETSEVSEMIKNIDKSEKIEQSLGDLRNKIVKLDIPPSVMDEIKNTNPNLFKNNIGIWNRCLIARSSFNGEDSDEMATQGLYDSYPGIKYFPQLEKSIKQVMASKWSLLAYESRRENKIPHNKIQPNVIIQEVVPVDYTFTLYTADARTNDKSKMVIDMSQGVCSTIPGAPYVFEYNKETGECKRTGLATKSYIMKIDNLPNPLMSSLGMIPSDYSKDPLNLSQKEYSPIMNKIFKVAKFIEKNFDGKPQDIEGGINFIKDRNGKICDVAVHIWQTRDAHLKEK